MDKLKGSRPWLHRTGRTTVVAVSVTSGVILFAITATLELWLHSKGSSPRVMILTSDALAGLFAGLLQYTTMQSLRRRQIVLSHRLQVISDMNHHIRNALEVIQLSVAASRQDKAASERINDATARIVWALKEILSSEPGEGT